MNILGKYKMFINLIQLLYAYQIHKHFPLQWHLLIIFQAFYIRKYNTTSGQHVALLAFCT